MDYFPEQDYDPDSGEYNSDFDFDPVFSRRVNLSDDIQAEITTDGIDFSPLADDLSDRLQELVNLGYFDIDGNRNPLEYNSLSGSDFDTQSATSRGPFITADAVERWLDDTGLRDQVDVYYDDDNDLYWIDADTSNSSGS